MTSLGALRVRGYRVWFGASFCMSFALQMIELTIGWSVYSRHQSALGRRGCVTIAIVWMRLFPALGDVDRMNELLPIVPDALLTVADGAN